MEVNHFLLNKLCTPSDCRFTNYFQLLPTMIDLQIFPLIFFMGFQRFAKICAPISNTGPPCWKRVNSTRV